MLSPQQREIQEGTRALQAKRESMTPKSQSLTSTQQIVANLVRPDPTKPRVIDSKESLTPKSQDFKFWIKVSMRGKYSDVERILANWREERQQAPRLATAIRLYDAILRGDRDTVREIAPLLMPEPAPAKVQRKRTSPPPVFNSSYESKGTMKEEGIGDAQFLELLSAIREVTGSDHRVNPVTWKVALRLREAGYNADAIFGFRRWFKTKDWRGRDKGEMPTLRDLENRIWLAKGWKDTGNPYEDDPANRSDLEKLDHRTGSILEREGAA